MYVTGKQASGAVETDERAGGGEGVTASLQDPILSPEWDDLSERTFVSSCVSAMELSGSSRGGA